MNPILNQIKTDPQSQQQSNPLQMLNRFQAFASTMTPEQAKQMVLQKLNSGEITQQQISNAVQQARKFAEFFGKK